MSAQLRMRLAALQGDSGLRLGPRGGGPKVQPARLADLESWGMLAQLGFVWDASRGVLVRRVEISSSELDLSRERLQWSSLAPLSEVVPTAGPLLLRCFDLETTGLQRGAGTVPFLYGWATLDERSAAVRVEQWLLPDLGQEGPLVRAALDQVQEAALLVTYNGSSYDLPLLRGRMVMTGVERAWPSTPHLDLLPVVRRLFRHRLDRCTLRAVEERLLHRERPQDLPGREAPERYWKFLATGDPTPLQEVVRHNQQDVISLLAVMERLVRQLAQEEPQPTDWLSLGRFIEARGDLIAAGEAYRKAEQVSPAPLDRAAALRRARLLRRQGRAVDALEAWTSIWARWRDPEAAEAICVDQEHRQRDPAAALVTARDGLQEGSVGWDQRFARRIWRLEDRLGPHRGDDDSARSLQLGSEAPRPWSSWLPGGESYEAWLALRRGRGSAGGGTKRWSEARVRVG